MSILKGGEIGRLKPLPSITHASDQIPIRSAVDGKLYAVTPSELDLGPIVESSTGLLNANYTVLADDYRIDFKITTAVTRRVTLPDPTTETNRILVIDNHYASNAGSLVDFSRTVDGVTAGSFTLGPDNSDKLMSDGIEWRSTV